MFSYVSTLLGEERAGLYNEGQTAGCSFYQILNEDQVNLKTCLFAVPLP